MIPRKNIQDIMNKIILSNKKMFFSCQIYMFFFNLTNGGCFTKLDLIMYFVVQGFIRFKNEICVSVFVGMLRY